MTYSLALLKSDLPFAPWVAVVMWLILFVSNHLLARATRKASVNSGIVVMQNREVLERGFLPQYVLAQALFGGTIFAITLWIEPHPVFVFLAGGLVVSLAWLFGLNLQAFLSARAMAQPGAVTGSLNLSNRAAIKQQVHRLAAGAAVCAILGTLLAHLSLLGGALFLGSTAIGYRRRIPS